MGQSLASKSFTTNNAAKDDWLHIDQDNSYLLSTILGNDPGSAVFQSFTQVNGLDIATLNVDGTFSLDTALIESLHLTSFEYVVRMANGTYSTAVVHFDHLSGTELLSNWDFEADNFAGDFTQVGSPQDWQNLGGASPVELSQHPYGLGTDPGFGDGETKWLDTAGSPGNIHIGQTTDVATGAKALLSVSMAAESITYLGNLYQTDPGAHVQFVFNGDVVMDVSLADFTNGVIDYNHFHDFSVDVTGKDGADTLEIIATGQDASYAGFAIDHVSLQQWTFGA